MFFVDVRGGARHPQGAVLHLLAQSDKEGAIILDLETPASQLADQRRLVETALECGEHHGQLAQHVGDGLHQTASSIMKQTSARPLSGTTQSSFSPRLIRPLRRNSSSMIQIDAEPTLP